MTEISPPTRTVGLRVVLAVFLVLHGIAHLVGTTGSFEAAAEGTNLDYLGGLWSVSDPALLRTLGVAWAIGGVAYVVVAWAIWSQAGWRIPALVAVTAYSLVLSVAALWTSWIGVIIDVGLLAAVVWLGVRGRARSST